MGFAEAGGCFAPGGKRIARPRFSRSFGQAPAMTQMKSIVKFARLPPVAAHNPFVAHWAFPAWHTWQRAMRAFKAAAENCGEDRTEATAGSAQARTANAGARGPSVRFPQRLRALFHAVCLATFGIICALAAAGAQAQAIKIGGTGTGLGAMKLLAQEFNKSRPEAQLIVTPSLGSTGAIRAVLAGAVDIGISARPVSADEKRQGAFARAYARTPFLIAAGAQNAIAGLTLAQLAEIYSGKVTRWPDGSPIRLVMRPDSDADSVALRAFSAEMDGAITAALARKGLRMADTDQANADALEKLPGALGTATLTQILTENRSLKPLALDGVAPTLQSLAAGRYRHFKTLHLVTGPNPSPLSKDFIAFVGSPAGQAVLARTGNLPVKE